jgi:hypothetical protein
VEHITERRKQHEFLLQFLTSGRGIAFNRMFAMKEYPRDILPLYSQGYSLARFLIAQGGRRKFVEYVGDGMRDEQWDEATRRHYGFHNLSDLQVSWLEWVKQGSRSDEAREMFVSRTGRDRASSGLPAEAVIRGQNEPKRGILSLPRWGRSASPEPTHIAPATMAREVPSAGSERPAPRAARVGSSGSWYANQKQQAQRPPAAADRPTTSRADSPLIHRR